MSDEFDIVHAGHDDIQDIVDWAVAAAALVVILQNAPQPVDIPTAIESLDNYMYVIDSMWNNMPRVLVTPAVTTAADAVEETLEEERQIEEFKEELKDL